MQSAPRAPHATRWYHRVHDYFLPHARNEHRPHFFRLTSVAIVAIGIIALECGAFAQVQFAFSQTGFLASVLPGVLETLTNADRASNGLGAVTENSKLDEAAQLVARDMAASGYFAHVSPAGKTPWDWLNHVGYDYAYAGQNLAVNFNDSQALENAWMASPEHRANIVKSAYTQVGFGVATGTYKGRDATFVVAYFAAPAQPATPAPAPRVVATLPRVPVSAPAHATSSDVVPAAVLGTSAALQALAPSRAPSIFARASASPLTTAAAILAGLAAFVALLMVLAGLRHARLPHRHVLLFGALLIALAAGLVVADRLYLGQLTIPADAAQSFHPSASS